jgi:hypothetical protein
VAKHAPLYTEDSKPGIGCLLLLISGDLSTNTIEILEPGLVYPRLKRFFRRTKRQ